MFKNSVLNVIISISILSFNSIECTSVWDCRRDKQKEATLFELDEDNPAKTNLVDYSEDEEMEEEEVEEND